MTYGQVQRLAFLVGYLKKLNNMQNRKTFFPPFARRANRVACAERTGYKAAGFTLMELLVVMAILALLVGLVGPQIMKRFSGAQAGTAQVQIADLEKAVDMFRLDVGRYPNANEGLRALSERPAGAASWNGPYLKGALPKDPWGNDYVYAYPAQNGGVLITSYGADGVPGGEGENADITNKK